MRRVPQARQDVQQVENIDGLCVAREVFVAVGLQRDLAVAQVNQRLARPTAEGDVIAQMLEDFCLAADLDQTHAATLDRTHLDRARQAGPVPFLRGFRRGEARAVLVAKQRLHEFLRRAHGPVHRVHRAEASGPPKRRCPFLVLLLPLREVRPGVEGTDHRHPLVVLGDDQQFALRRRIGGRLLRAKRGADSAI